MVIENKDLKIALYVTEERENNWWTITNITLGYIQQSVVDLTPT
jgi:hypothetical protein